MRNGVLEPSRGHMISHLDCLFAGRAEQVFLEEIGEMSIGKDAQREVITTRGVVSKQKMRGNYRSLNTSLRRE